MKPGAESKPIGVLLMVRELGSGGIERDVTKLAIGMDRTRFTPYVASFRAEGLRYEDLRKAGVPVIHLPISSMKSPRALSAATQFVRAIVKNEIRVVHAFDASGVFGIPLAKALRVPAVLISSLGHRDLLDSKTLRQMKLMDRWADTVVVNCNAMRRHLVEDYAVPDEHIELCYNGVDTSEFYPAAEAKPNPVIDATLVIGTVCVLRPEKSLEVLQEAFAKIWKQGPGIRLLIVGNGPELQKLRDNGVRLGIQSATVFQPAVADVAPLLRAMDIFVSSSRSEAFSNSILEAMACGCCVVGSRVGGTPELVEDETRGLLFTPGNADELADKLARVVEDAPARKRMGCAASAFARERLNMRICVARNMEIYTSVLARKGAFG